MKEFILKFYFLFGSICCISAFTSMIIMRNNVDFEVSGIFIISFALSIITLLFQLIFAAEISKIARSEDKIDEIRLDAKYELREANQLLNAMKTLALNKLGVSQKELDIEIERQNKLNLDK